MGHIFSKKKSRITEHDRAILKLKQQRDKLRQYQRRIENNLEADRQLAKRLISDGKKDRAKTLLRKKRFQEQALKTTDGQLENLERMAHDLEFAEIEVKVVDGLKVGNEALKKVNATLNIDEIEKMLDETREGVEKQQEIDALLFGALSMEDEEAVMNELDQIISETLPDVPEVELIGEPNGALPEVPADDIEIEEKREKTKERRTKDERIALEA